MSSIGKNAPSLKGISDFISNFKNIDVDKKTIGHSSMLTADTYATAFSGIETEAFKTAIKSKGLLFGEGRFEIWGTGKKTSLLGAIFYNALAISSTDFDEGHRGAVGHPASAVVPVALVLGGFLKKSLSVVLKSVIVGYEISTRFSMARNKEKITTYSTGRWAALGSAATAAYLSGLNAKQISQALSNAAVLSPAMLGGSTDVSTGSMSKEGVAWAVQAGVQSALMAKDGFSGPYLFVDATDDYIADILLKDLGKSWLINSNYFKPYACCRWLHPAVKASGEIINSNTFKLNEIKTIRVFAFARALDLVEHKYPENTVEAQFHLPFTIALMLQYGEVKPGHFQKAELNNKDLVVLMDEIRLITDEEYSAAFPAQLQSRVEIVLNSGKKFVKEVLVAPWEHGFHPSLQELKQKFDKQAEGAEHRNWESFFM
jgi:2-methylcitrate dehydratase PrpD